MATLSGNLARISRAIPLILNSNLSSICHFSTTLQQESNLESQLNVLDIDDALAQETALTNGKLESIFSKIRQSSSTKTSSPSETTTTSLTSSQKLQFEDLFPLSSKEPPSDPIEEIDSEAQESIEPTINDDTEISATQSDEVYINFMTEDDILTIPSTANIKQILSTNKNTIDNFGENLYVLLRYNPSGIMENDIKLTYFKHYGCDIPFKYQSAMIKYIIGSCSHLFIINNDVFGRKIILNRPNIENEKYLMIDNIPYNKLSYLFYYLLTNNNKNTLSPSTNLQIINQNEQQNQPLLRLSELQNEFYKQFNGLFITKNLYILINRIGAIKKISSNNGGDLTDFYLIWNYVQEDLAGMNLLFKIWHILTQYPNGLKWDQIQRCFCDQYGELLLFPEHYVGNRPQWRYFIKICEENTTNPSYYSGLSQTRQKNRIRKIYKVADPSISEGKLLLIDVNYDKSNVSLINELISKCFKFENYKQRKWILLDILPLRNATSYDNVWKYVLCFTNEKHASYFYRKYHSTSMTIKGVADNNDKELNVNKLNLNKLKIFLDEIIPQSLPFSLSMTPNSSFNNPSSSNNKYSNPLPFEIPLPQTQDDNDNISINFDDKTEQQQSNPIKTELKEYIKSQEITNIIPTDVTTSKQKEEKENKMISPQVIETIWGLLTNYCDGLTTEQICYLYNQQMKRGIVNGKHDNTLNTDQLCEILTDKSSWFIKQTMLNGDDRWYHKSIYDIQNKTILLKPEQFILYEYLEEFIENMDLGEIEDKTRYRSNLLIHFKDEKCAEKLLKSNEYLQYNDIKVNIDAFSPKYSYERILPSISRPIRYDSYVNQILTAELSKQHSSMSCLKLFDILRSDKKILHHRIQDPIQFARLLLDAYTPHVHIFNKHDKYNQKNDIEFKDINDICFSKYNQYPRRMPLDLQRQNVSTNVKNKRYYNDIREFFMGYPNGISLSKFRIEFNRDYQYIPAVPSLSEYLKAADIYSFYMTNHGDIIDLYLLPIQRYNENETENEYGAYKYPQNGIILEGLPKNTNQDGLSRIIKDNMGYNYVMRRGIDRFIIWYNSLQVAESAKESFMSNDVKQDGLKIIDDLPHLCNHVLTWIDTNSVY